MLESLDLQLLLQPGMRFHELLTGASVSSNEFACGVSDTLVLLGLFTHGLRGDFPDGLRFALATTGLLTQHDCHQQ